ncbi:hypothetical protein GCM10007907_24890 [Chitinimonas prasina]|uniref:Replication protein n=1 Tax=Chitinimonas prasina TaxID=1434937 RepID=A0ABQ5YIE1_9NEIS|nr:protein rep [Chitinimonas prasina]GLR13699.1 hypothetical protein GCM10007907_24890 [Chitinimonas prasina]
MAVQHVPLISKRCQKQQEAAARVFAAALDQQRSAQASAWRQPRAGLGAALQAAANLGVYFEQSPQPDLEPGSNSLGIDGKSSATDQHLSGTAAAGTAGQHRNLLSSRARRYRMQRHAQRLLPGEVVSGCSRNFSASNGRNKVEIIGRADSGAVSYRGIHVCGSVWHCPVCANKISEARRTELQTGIAAHHLTGGRVYMLTLTFPHNLGMDLAECLEGLSEALKIFKRSRAWRTCGKAIDYQGAVRALEVTYGANGWHPHTHELIFASGDQDEVLLELAALRDYWAAAVFRAGLGQINEHGFMVGNADKAADYVAKFGNSEETDWDVSREMTRQHSKLARKKGRTPFALLFDAMGGDFQAGELFQEYAREFKGKRQLYYSPGLKKHLGLDDVSDQDIAESEQLDLPGEEPIQVIYTLNAHQWALVYRSNRRGELLDTAAKHGAEGVYLFLKALAIRRSGDDLQPNYYYPEHLQ